MTYKTKCNGSCLERIDEQAKTIKHLQERLAKNVEGNVKASKKIVQLRNDRWDLFNENIELQERIRFLESEVMKTKLSSTKGEGWF